MSTKLVSLLVATASILLVALPSVATAHNDGDSLNNVRDATAIFRHPAAALAAGYDLLTDAAGVACIDQPGTGAMGIHYVKGALIQANTLDPARPQALVYQRTPDGHLDLVAVEYVVFQAAWDAAHPAKPTLFGQEFMLTPAGNRFGLPAFYSLHAWVWKHNPSGTFGMWNPTVKCAS